MNSVLAVAKRVFERVPFYEHLYGSDPETIEEVPFIRYSTYHRGGGVTDCIDPAVELGGALPPYHRAFRRLPFTVVESEGDIDDRQARLERALVDLSITDEQVRILMVTDEEHGPFACDLSTGLGWEGLPASIFYDCANPQGLNFQIMAHEPDYIIWCRPTLPPECMNFDDKKIVLAHSIDFPLPTWDGPMLLFCDEMNLIGSRPAGRREFDVDPEQIFLEPGPGGRPCLTSLIREAFPVVRYELAHDFEVVG